MADFCITAIRYSKEEPRHIEYVHVRELKPGCATTDSSPRMVSRAFVADLIRLEKASFQTQVKKTGGSWAPGAEVHMVEGEYLSTVRNGTKLDNLGELPVF